MWVQGGFRNQLRQEVATFVLDAKDFRADWVTNRPMVPNLAPADAIVRLKLFQQAFEVIFCFAAFPFAVMVNVKGDLELKIGRAMLSIS